METVVNYVIIRLVLSPVDAMKDTYCLVMEAVVRMLMSVLQTLTAASKTALTLSEALFAVAMLAINVTQIRDLVLVIYLRILVINSNMHYVI
jgi:hypothetical protein